MDFIAKNKDIYFVNGINDPGKYGSKTPTGNSRVYNCQQCERAFTRYEHLSRHIMLTHNKLKPYECGICSRAFSRRDLLLRHAKNLHEGSELAIPRIRKQIKKPSEEETLIPFKLDEESRLEEEKSSEGSRLEEEEKSEDSRLDHEKLDDLSPLSPDTKRIKLSVDMLVS